MSALLLDGRAYAEDLRRELAAEAAAFVARAGYTPVLAIVAVRDGAGSAASDVYIRQLRRAARAVGIIPRLVELPTASDAAMLVERLARLNDEPAVRGVLVQLPLPPQIGRDALLDAIIPAKDVDGISATSAGQLFLGQPALVPATSAAVMEVLDRAGVALAGRRAVIVGASAVVGRPLLLMLLRRDATVSVCHIYTSDLAAFTRAADILIVAAGRPGLITGAMIKPGAVVVDVGINVLADGAVVGDVAFAEAAAVAGMLTPVPGGVGPLTTLMVMRHTLRALDSSTA